MHEQWITGQRDLILNRHGSGVSSTERQLDLTDTALVLSDVTTILGAGHSIDLLVHRTLAVLEGRKVSARLEQPNGCRDIEDFLSPWLR